jgi:hypothetical protein
MASKHWYLQYNSIVSLLYMHHHTHAFLIKTQMQLFQKSEAYTKGLSVTYLRIPAPSSRVMSKSNPERHFPFFQTYV